MSPKDKFSLLVSITRQGGGAINMGLDDFKGSGTCSVMRPNATIVSVNGSSVFAGNVAKLQGGAIAVQSGTLLMQVGLLQQQPCHLNCNITSCKSSMSRHPESND